MLEFVPNDLQLLTDAGATARFPQQRGLADTRLTDDDCRRRPSGPGGKRHNSLQAHELPGTSDECRPAGRRSAGLGRSGDGVEPPALVEALQPEPSPIHERDSRHSPGQMLHDVRHKDLAAGSLRRDPRGSVHGSAEQVAFALRDVARVDTDPHSEDRVWLGTVVAFHAMLNGYRASECPARRREGDHKSIAEVLDLPAVVASHLVAHDPLVRAEDLVRHLVSPTGRYRRRPFDVGEEKSNRPLRLICFQTSDRLFVQKHGRPTRRMGQSGHDRRKAPLAPCACGSSQSSTMNVRVAEGALTFPAKSIDVAEASHRPVPMLAVDALHVPPGVTTASRSTAEPVKAFTKRTVTRSSSDSASEAVPVTPLSPARRRRRRGP